MRPTLCAALLLAVTVAALPTAAADPLPDPDCIAIYREIIAGPPLYVAMTSGCSFRVELCDRTLGEAVEAENPVDCV